MVAGILNMCSLVMTALNIMYTIGNRGPDDEAIAMVQQQIVLLFHSLFNMYLWSWTLSQENDNGIDDTKCRLLGLRICSGPWATALEGNGNNGFIWTLQELDENGRQQEAALQACFHLATSRNNTNNINQANVNLFQRLWESGASNDTDEGLQRDFNAIADFLATVNNSDDNVLHFDGLGYDVLEMRGYVQFDVLSLIFIP